MSSHSRAQRSAERFVSAIRWSKKKETTWRKLEVLNFKRRGGGGGYGDGSVALKKHWYLHLKLSRHLCRRVPSKSSGGGVQERTWLLVWHKGGVWGRCLLYTAHRIDSKRRVIRPPSTGAVALTFIPSRDVWMSKRAKCAALHLTISRILLHSRK